MNATRIFWPNANSPKSVEGPSANTSPRLIGSPKFTQGIWLIQVFWLERVYLIKL